MLWQYGDCYGDDRILLLYLILITIIIIIIMEEGSCDTGSGEREVYLYVVCHHYFVQITGDEYL